jgi:hypothetical protein
MYRMMFKDKPTFEYVIFGLCNSRHLESTHISERGLVFKCHNLVTSAEIRRIEHRNHLEPPHKVEPARAVARVLKVDHRERHPRESLGFVSQAAAATPVASGAVVADTVGIVTVVPPAFAAAHPTTSAPVPAAVQGLTLVPISAQLELLYPPYNAK